MIEKLDEDLDLSLLVKIDTKCGKCGRKALYVFVSIGVDTTKKMMNTDTYFACEICIKELKTIFHYDEGTVSDDKIIKTL